MRGSKPVEVEAEAKKPGKSDGGKWKVGVLRGCIKNRWDVKGGNNKV